MSRVHVCPAFIVSLFGSRTCILLVMTSTFLIDMAIWMHWSVGHSSKKIPVAAVSDTSSFRVASEVLIFEIIRL